MTANVSENVKPIIAAVTQNPHLTPLEPNKATLNGNHRQDWKDIYPIFLHLPLHRSLHVGG